MKYPFATGIEDGYPIVVAGEDGKPKRVGEAARCGHHDR